MIVVDPETREEAISLVLDILVPFDKRWDARDKESASLIEENRDMRRQLHKIWGVLEKDEGDKLASIKKLIDEWLTREK